VGANMTGAIAPMPFWGFAIASQVRQWLAELRIDVRLDEPGLEGELDALRSRMPSIDGLVDESELYSLPPEFTVLARQADGEYFIYVFDRLHDRLAAYVTLSRLIEVNRRADRHVRSPHAKVARAYRRRGIVSAVYRRWLESGVCLMSGARQSAAAHALWVSLSGTYRMAYVRLDNKKVILLDEPVLPEQIGHLNVRAVLAGEGGMERVVEAPAVRPIVVSRAVPAPGWR